MMLEGSDLDELFLVINLSIQLIKISNQFIALKWHLWLSITWHLLLEFHVQLVPLFIKLLSILRVLLNLVSALLLRSHLERIVEGEWVDLFEDCFESDERFLQDFVPVILSQVHDDWDEHGERLLLVGLENVEEIVILEEAHGSIGNLQMNTTNTFDDSLEQLRNQRLNFVNLANFEDLL